MPNCDFYATENDHAQVLDWLFAEETCRVFESYSQFESPLKEFHSTAEVLAEFDRVYANGTPWHTVNLQLYVIGAGPPFTPKRIRLNPESCNGATFRYAAEGLGLVQLYLSRVAPGGLRNSHTNHFSAAAAGRWEPADPEQPTSSDWDFKRITAFSSRLSRQIRKSGVARIHGRVVLPGALASWNEGMALLPYRREDGQLTVTGR